MKQSDEELVELARSGDQDAYAELYSRLLPCAKNCLRKILRICPDEIEICAHDAVARAFMGLPRFQGACSIKTWTFSIASNVGYEKLRHYRSGIVANSVPIDGADENGESVGVDIGEEDHGYGAWEAQQDLQRVLPRVPSKLRVMLALRYLEGLRPAEIAARMNLSVAAVKTRVYRGLVRAKEIMNELENTKSETKAVCVQCQKENRFRFADVTRDGVPLCQWCDKSLQRVPNDSAANREQRPTPPLRSKTFNKSCRHCGEAFTTTAPAAVFAPGHPHIALQAKKSPTDSLSVNRPAQGHHVNGNGSAIQRVEQDPENQTVAIHVTSRALDSMWEALSLKDKARAFEILLSE